MRTFVMAALVLQSLAIEPLTATIEEGSKTVFVVIGRYANGARKNVSDQVIWSSSDGKIASVAADGTSQGIAPGKVKIKASIGKIAARAELTVQARLTALRIDPAVTMLAPGESYAFAARGRYSDGTAALLTERANWSVEGDAVKIDASGRATAVGKGSATIVAIVRGQRATASVLVSEGTAAPARGEVAEAPAAEPAPEPAPQPPHPVLQKVVIEPEVDSLRERESRSLKAWGRYSDGTVRDITREAVWSSSDVQVARANFDGSVTALRFGTATIAATLDTYSGVAAMTVMPVVAHIAIRPANLSLRHRGTQRLRAIAVYTDNSVHDITDRAEWTSSDEGVASARDGVLVGTAPGSATVTAVFEDFRASAAVDVRAIVESISIQPQVASITIGQTQQLTAMATLSDGRTQDVSATAKWSCDSAAVRVSATGLVTAAMEGTAVVKVRMDDTESATTVNVSKGDG
jgi:hypothetical protein